MGIFMDRVFRRNFGLIKIDVTILIYETIDLTLRSGESFYTIIPCFILQSCTSLTFSAINTTSVVVSEYPFSSC